MDISPFIKIFGFAPVTPDVFAEVTALSAIEAVTTALSAIFAEVIASSAYFAVEIEPSAISAATTVLGGILNEFNFVKAIRLSP